MLTELLARLEIFVPIVPRLQVHIAQILQIYAAQNDEGSPRFFEFVQFVEKCFAFFVQRPEAFPIAASNEFSLILLQLAFNEFHLHFDHRFENAPTLIGKAFERQWPFDESPQLSVI